MRVSILLKVFGDMYAQCMSGCSINRCVVDNLGVGQGDELGVVVRGCDSFTETSQIKV